MRLIIAGSRTFNPSITRIDRHVRDAQLILDEPTITVILCGMARGVDLAGKRWAEANSIPVEEYPANWKKYGKAAGPIRNTFMASRADALLLMWDGESRGSAHMKQAAQERGLYIHEVIM